MLGQVQDIRISLKTFHCPVGLVPMGETLLTRWWATPNPHSLCPSLPS